MSSRCTETTFCQIPHNVGIPNLLSTSLCASVGMLLSCLWTILSQTLLKSAGLLACSTRAKMPMRTNVMKVEVPYSPVCFCKKLGQVRWHSSFLAGSDISCMKMSGVHASKGMHTD